MQLHPSNTLEYHNSYKEVSDRNNKVGDHTVNPIKYKKQQ